MPSPWQGLWPIFKRELRSLWVTPLAWVLLTTFLFIQGGVFYSIGGVLYAAKWPNPWPRTFGHHEFFHAATVLAALCHLVAVWLVLF